MPQLVHCENRHRIKETHRATSRRFSENSYLGKCHCGKNIQYAVSQFDPFTGKTRIYDVLKVKAFLPPELAEKRGWDPVIFLLRNRETGTTVLWPYYWKKDRNGKWANGQYPPLLNINDLEEVIREFKEAV